MAKVTQTILDKELREKIAGIVIDALASEGITAKVYGSGKVTSSLSDSAGTVRPFTVDVTVRKGSRDGEPFDGDYLAEVYEEEKVKAAMKAAEREAESKRKQAERAAKDKEKAEKAAAKAAAEAAKVKA